jgi:uncharacterized LabA/DUF88 family protein
MLFVDTNNLFHGSMQLHEGVVDYALLVNHLIEKYGDPLKPRFAYVAEREKSQGFANFLRGLDFIVRSKEIREGKADSFDVDLSLDALIRGSKRVIICSSSLNLLTLVEELNGNGTMVCVHSFGIPYGIRRACFTEELPRKVLRNGVTATVR